MKKRIFACAALLVCLAQAALAGGQEESIEYFKKPDWENAPGVYTYGGSRRDWINSMAAAPDGRIAVAGYTESSDGTLSDRTKTWRAGWVMMLDQEMNVEWNFCSRSGDADHMRCPVFHDNGHVTVVHHTEGKQLKIVWVDENGEEFLSDTVMTVKAEDEMISVIGAMADGYLMCRTEDYGQKRTFTLFDWMGGVLWTLEGTKSVQAVSEKHLLCETEEGLFLSAVDGEGKLTTLCRAAEADNGSVKREYMDLITLSDGGAAACGSIWEGTAPVYAQGIISRWDEKGNLLFEMIVTMGELHEMVRTDNGFAATCSAQDELRTDIKWKLLEFDEKGVLRGRHELYDNESMSAGGLLARAADGKLICAQAVGEFDREDVFVTAIKAQ